MIIEQEVLQPGEQRYTIAFPEEYPGDDDVPLILALHFAGHGTPYYGRTILEYLVEPALRDLGAVIVAPDCTAKSWSEPQSEKDVLAVLDFVVNNFAVDRKRILVTGYSMGGNGAWYLAARNQELFSAAVVMSGWPPAEVGQVEWQVPVYVIHSRGDEFIPIEPTQYAASIMAEQGVEIEFVILEDVTHFETHRFIKPLNSAIHWINGIWQSKSR